MLRSFQCFGKLKQLPYHNKLFLMQLLFILSILIFLLFNTNLNLFILGKPQFEISIFQCRGESSGIQNFAHFTNQLKLCQFMGLEEEKDSIVILLSKIILDLLLINFVHIKDLVKCRGLKVLAILKFQMFFTQSISFH